MVEYQLHEIVRFPDAEAEAARLISMSDPIAKLKKLVADIDRGFAEARRQLSDEDANTLLNRLIAPSIEAAASVAQQYLNHTNAIAASAN